MKWGKLRFSISNGALDPYTWSPRCLQYFMWLFVVSSLQTHPSILMEEHWSPVGLRPAGETALTGEAFDKGRRGKQWHHRQMDFCVCQWQHAARNMFSSLGLLTGQVQLSDKGLSIKGGGAKGRDIWGEGGFLIHWEAQQLSLPLRLSVWGSVSGWNPPTHYQEETNPSLLVVSQSEVESLDETV